MRIPVCFVLVLVCAASAAATAVCPTTPPAAGSCTVGVAAPTSAAANAVIAANSGGGGLALTSPPSASSVSAGNVCYRLGAPALQRGQERLRVLALTRHTVYPPRVFALTRRVPHIHSGALRLRGCHVQLRHRPRRKHLPCRQHTVLVLLRAVQRLQHPPQRLSRRPERVHRQHQRLQRSA